MIETIKAIITNPMVIMVLKVLGTLFFIALVYKIMNWIIPFIFSGLYGLAFTVLMLFGIGEYWFHDNPVFMEMYHSLVFTGVLLIELVCLPFRGLA